MRRSLRAVRAAAGLVLSLGGCDLPKDPEGTLDTVRGGVMRVGISEAPPWTVLENGAVAGVEAELVETLAGELGARVAWVRGTEADLLEALRRFELDLVIAGLTDASPWKGRIGLTRPYVSTTSLIGVPAGMAIGEDPSGVEVAVAPGDPVAAELRAADAEPVADADLAAAGRPVAAEDWQLMAWGFRPTSIVLAEHRHVLAVPPGENAWLARIETFLSGRAPDVRLALVAAAEP